MKWEYKSKKIPIITLTTTGTDDTITDERVKIELDAEGANEWELVSVVDEPESTYVRAFFKRVVAAP